MKRIKLSESKLHNIIKNAITTVLKESASRRLYHFLSFDRFEEIVNTDCFTPSSNEKKWHNGKNAMSFSRTKTFREGWPTIMYSGYDGKGDDWCAIRLTINGDLINRKPNFKLDGKQYNMSVKPFDWAYKDNNDGDPECLADNYGNGIWAQNGKGWMMQSDNYTDTYLPIKYKNGYPSCVGDKQGHPFSQAEDRLTTHASKIPNASQFILRVDILLMPYNFNENNLEDRLHLYNIIRQSDFSNKIHLYTNMRNLELNKPQTININILKQTTARNYKNPIQFGKTKQDF